MNAIVVVDQNWAIGREGDLLFSLPTDMKRFRSLTLGGTVILGRKTLDSFPGGKALPGRRNIVVSRNVDFDRAGCEVAASLDAALELAAGTEDDKLWIIGGGSVYTAMLSRCKRVYLTKVDAVAEDADTFFPNLDENPAWEAVEESGPQEDGGFSFRYVTYRRRG